MTSVRLGEQRLECWAIVELMGHVKVAGLVSEEERFGCKMGRVEIPTESGGFVTQWFSGGSVYRMTPVSEEVARAVALRNQPTPVHRWELPVPQESPPRVQPTDYDPFEDSLESGIDDDCEEQDL